MARKKRNRKFRHEPYPGWMWMVFGLTIGLSVSFAIYIKYREAIQPTESVSRPPASMAAPIKAEPEPTLQPVASETEKETQFTFYDLLPKLEVTIPEVESDVNHEARQSVVEQPGVYVLQAGSFTTASDAEHRRTRLALFGIEAQVERGISGDRTYHRVRIGPTRDLDALNRIRGQLRAEKIDVLRIRLSD